MVATAGFILPSLCIIIALAGVITSVEHLKWVQNAFAGIRACICVQILNAVIRLAKKALVDIWTCLLYTSGTNTFAWGNETALYGTMTKNADGTYRYVLDNTKEAVRELNAGDTLTETFTFSYTDEDGDKATGSVTITIHGVDDYTVIYAPGAHGTWDAEDYTTPRLFKGDETPAAPDTDTMHRCV